MPYDCFLSYSSRDLAIAGRIHRRLAAAGLNVWFDKVQLGAGDNWHGKIESDCEASRVVLPVLTPRWKISEWTRFETYGAENVIPLLVEGEWSDVATPPLDRSQMAAIPGAKGSESAWQDLIQRIRECCAAPPPDKAPRVAHVPIPAKSEHFFGRDQTLADLHERFFRTPTAALTQGHSEALTALGGVGKTTIARHYCEKFWRCYRQMFWVDCRAGIELGFARIHDLLREFGHDLPAPEKAAWALHRLSQRDTPTLLVLDNAEDEESAVKWVPNSGNCHTLITSRFTAWSTVEKFEVWVLAPEPSRELLMARSGRKGTAGDTPAERAAADELAKRLGYLPLALEQAAAYVGEEKGFGFADYLKLYAEHEKELLARKAPGLTQYPDSVYVTWRATIDKLPAGARAMLRLHAFLAATPFPFQMYLNGGSAIAEEAGAAESPTELEVREWKKALTRYSMVQQDPVEDAFSVHALTQAVERHELGEKAGETLARTMGMVVAGSEWPSWEAGSRLVWSKLLPHAERLCEHAREHATEIGATQSAVLLARVAEAYRNLGDYQVAIPPMRECVAILERLQCPEHTQTLTSVNNLALLLHSKGDYSQAEPLYRRVLEARERVLGSEHPDTLTSMNNLAMLLHSKGDYAQAEPLCRRALEARERVLGSEHPDTLTSVNNLAMLLQSKGDYAQAEPLYRRAVEAMERVLGSEHPDTSRSVNNLAELLRSKGDYAQAEPLYRRALEAWERVLGAEHPDTLKSMNNLGLLLYSKGDYAQAEPLYRRALGAWERVLGPQHPDALQSVNNLAALLYSKGDYAQAEPLFRRALEARERVLGPNHPDALRSVNNLAELLRSRRDYEQAEPLYRRALDAWERMLGPEHPNTLVSVNNLGLLLDAKGDYGRAEPLYRRALEGWERVLGPEHPDTLQAVNNLGSLHYSKGDYARAEPLLRRALEAKERVLGPEHPATLQSVNNLAFLLRGKGDYARAEPLLRRALEARERVLGPEHPATLQSMNNLAFLLRSKGDHEQAEPLLRRALDACERVLGSGHPLTQQVSANLEACRKAAGTGTTN